MSEPRWSSVLEFGQWLRGVAEKMGNTENSTQHVSTDYPTNAQGNDGDIWVVCESEPYWPPMTLKYTSTSTTLTDGNVASITANNVDSSPVALTVDWGDGSAVETHPGGLLTHTFATEGVFTCTLVGSVDVLLFDGSTVDNQAAGELMTEILEWGNAATTSIMLSERQLTTVPANEPPSVTSMTSMFGGCAIFNQDISGWDVSRVTDMSYMFSGCYAFNQPLAAWDVSNVTTMQGMFYDGVEFNQSLSGWNVGNVTDMSYMFNNHSKFNGSLAGWDVTSVTDMTFMFMANQKFNQDLSSWDTSNIVTMSSMFQQCPEFNGNVRNWDLSSLVNMSGMFHSCSVFNQDISTWVTTTVVNMSNVFESCLVFNQDISAWDVSNVTAMTAMFYKAAAFDQDISGWGVSAGVEHTAFALNTNASWTVAEQPQWG